MTASPFYSFLRFYEFNIFMFWNLRCVQRGARFNLSRKNVGFFELFIA